MIILHITPHMGGGVGAVINDWVIKDKSNKHVVCCLGVMNQQSINSLNSNGVLFFYECSKSRTRTSMLIMQADIVLVHYWNHEMLYSLLSHHIPSSRIILWCHNTDKIPDGLAKGVDLIVGTSKILNCPQIIWSTINMEPFLNNTKLERRAKFQVGYVGTVDYKKIHPSFIKMCLKIHKELRGDVQFTVVGTYNLGQHLAKSPDYDCFNFVGHHSRENILLDYGMFDVFGYPLKRNHYGTCEQVIGEAMSCGIVPVCMNNEAEKEIIQEGITGFLCANEDEYIDNIIHLYYKRNLLKFMGDNARDASIKIYDIDNMIKKWNETFKTISEYNKSQKNISISMEE